MRKLSNNNCVFPKNIVKYKKMYGEYMAKIEIVDLKKTYTGGKTAVENFTLTIDGGEFVVLLGPAESGKTAVLRSLLSWFRLQKYCQI